MEPPENGPETASTVDIFNSTTPGASLVDGPTPTAGTTPTTGPTRPAGTAPPACDRKGCQTPAVETIRYAGVRFCGSHFVDFVKKRFKKEVRKQGGFPTGATVGVAVSGGKDSIVALRLVHEMLTPRLRPEHGGANPNGDVSLVVLTIDEGIAGYREHGLRIATETATELGIPHHVLSYAELVGVTMDQASSVKGERNECSFCGVFRRSALNRLARDAGCTVLVTGHNLDDTSQAVLMNLVGGDIARLNRMGPHKETKDDLVPRRLPLRTIPEKEIYLTALLSGWEIDDHECPYAVNSQRYLYRDMLARMEDATPGTRHSLLQTLDTLRPYLPQIDAARERGDIKRCDTCNEPASGTVCKTCELGEHVRQALPKLTMA